VGPLELSSELHIQNDGLVWLRRTQPHFRIAYSALLSGFAPLVPLPLRAVLPLRPGEENPLAARRNQTLTEHPTGKDPAASCIPAAAGFVGGCAALPFGTLGVYSAITEGQGMSKTIRVS
jgi:hypothetical protein